MIDIGIALFLFGGLRMLISLFNYLSPIYLPEKARLRTFPSLSILIPARDEEENLNYLLSDLVSFEYPDLEIIVYDDLSTDHTSEVVKSYSLNYPHIKLIRGEQPPKGWLGKNYACHQLAQTAQGEKLLFLDADVRVENGVLERALTRMEKWKVELLSIFPKQILPTLESFLAIPLMNWILLSLLPLVWVRIFPFRAFSAANGQFMLFDGNTYRQLLPHAQCRSNQVEDMAIMRLYKKKKMKVATLLGSDYIRCRMYSSLEEGVQGFSKNVFQFFGGSVFLTFTFALIIAVSPFYIAFTMGIFWALLYLVIIAMNHIYVSLASEQSIRYNLLLLVLQQLVFWKIILTARRSRKRKEMIWKGRNVYQGF